MPCSQIDLPYQHIYYNKIRNFFKQFLRIFFILSGFAGKYDNAVRFLLLRGFQKAKLIFRFQKSASGAIRYDKLTMKPFLSRVKCVCLRKNNNYDSDVVIIFQVYVYYMIKHKKCYRYYAMCDAGSFFQFKNLSWITMKFGLEPYICSNESGHADITTLAMAPRPSSSGIQRRYGFEYTAASWDSTPASYEVLP